MMGVSSKTDKKHNTGQSKCQGSPGRRPWWAFSFGSPLSCIEGVKVHGSGTGAERLKRFKVQAKAASEWKAWRKAEDARLRRAVLFFIKCRDGLLVHLAMGQNIFEIICSESDYAQGMGFEFWKGKVHALQEKLRRDYGRGSAFAIAEHIQSVPPRYNRHILFCCNSVIETTRPGKVTDLQRYWESLDVYGSWLKVFDRTHRANNAWSIASYLAGYAGGKDKFQRATFSNNWLFAGAFKYGKAIKRVYGDYPGIPELVALHGMAKTEREKEMCFNLDLRILGGYEDGI
jgi:hypothetical protein